MSEPEPSPHASPLASEAPLLASLLASEALAAGALAAAMAAEPDHPARCQPMGGGMLVAHGPGRYVNRAIGVGPCLDQAEIKTIEGFYADVGLPPSLQLSATADDETLRLLSNAGFRPQWFRSLLARPLIPPGPADQPRPATGPYRIEIVDDDNLDRWLDTLARGNTIIAGPARAVSDEYGRAAHGAVGSHDFLALVGEEPVGCGSVQVARSTAWLGGAATVPGHRRRGVQAALLTHRLDWARSSGCLTAAATATPGQTSARNLMRTGFGLVDTQLVLTGPGP